MKLRIDKGYLLLEGLPRLCDDLEQQYWIQDRVRYHCADGDSKLEDCEIINCEGDVIFGNLRCWCHAKLIVELLNLFECYRIDPYTEQYGLVIKLPAVRATDTGNPDA